MVVKRYFYTTCILSGIWGSLKIKKKKEQYEDHSLKSKMEVSLKTRRGADHLFSHGFEGFSLYCKSIKQAAQICSMGKEEQIAILLFKAHFLLQLL